QPLWGVAVLKRTGYLPEIFLKYRVATRPSKCHLIQRAGASEDVEQPHNIAEVIVESFPVQRAPIQRDLRLSLRYGDAKFLPGIAVHAQRRQIGGRTFADDLPYLITCIPLAAPLLHIYPEYVPFGDNCKL